VPRAAEPARKVRRLVGGAARSEPTGLPALENPGRDTPGEFQPIRQLRAHEYVAEQIRRHILLHLIMPGEPLPTERELVATFKVGRPTIQHAIMLLAADGLVEARRGRNGGTFVTAPARDDSALNDLIQRVAMRTQEITDLLDYRRLIEPAIAEQAAIRRRAADVRAMSSALARMGEARHEAEYMREDTLFHIAVARAGRNPIFSRVVEEIRLGLNDAMTLLPESEAWHQWIDVEHDSLLEAIEARDGATARHAMEIHVESAERGLRALVRALERRTLGIVRRERTGRVTSRTAAGVTSGLQRRKGRER